jgi:putative transposase
LREKAKFDVDGRLLRIEKLPTKIKLRQRLRFDGQAKQVTISKRAGKYFASILIETQDYNPKDVDRQSIVGVDFGIKSLATLSNGVVFGANQKLKANLKKLKQAQQSLSRKQKGSNRRARAKLQVAKLHFRISNQRQAVLHELSDYLTHHFDRIVIEDLNVKGMVKNHKLARSISDAGFGYLRQQIEYKARLRNCEVIIADRFFPSSKQCSACGSIQKTLSLSERTYHCDCGLEIDRDLNAAINLKSYGEDRLQPTQKRT